MPKQSKTYRFTVRGWGAFPTDMLRYDHCWPATQQDASRLTHYYDRIVTGFEKYDVTLCSNSMPTSDRWASFDFKVIKTDIL